MVRRNCEKPVIGRRGVRSSSKLAPRGELPLPEHLRRSSLPIGIVGAAVNAWIRLQEDRRGSLHLVTLNPCIGNSDGTKHLVEQWMQNGLSEYSHASIGNWMRREFKGRRPIGMYVIEVGAEAHAHAHGLLWLPESEADSQTLQERLRGSFLKARGNNQRLAPMSAIDVRPFHSENGLGRYLTKAWSLTTVSSPLWCEDAP